MSLWLRVILVFIVLLYFGMLLYFIKKKMMTLKYILIWLLAGVIVGVLLIWPQLLAVLMKVLGVEVPANGLFIIAIFFIVLIVLSLTAIASQQTEKINILLQENAILEKRVRDLEEISKEKEK